jgi:signal peptidase II
MGQARACVTARLERASRAVHKHRRMLRYGLIIAVIVVIADQITKALVLGPVGFTGPGECEDYFRGCGFIELTPFFDMQMVWNRGVSFGLLKANQDLARWGLVALSFVISGVFLWWLRTAERRLTASALGLVVGGALGNVIDRIRFGAVADFLDFNGLWFPWVFNVADAAINIGAALLVLDFLLHGEKPRDPAGTPAPQNGHDQPGA